jgi:DNA-binding transcriptional ArsR family regulator
MGTDLLGDIRREIDARLAELRPALTEYEQLLAAADALGLDEPPKHDNNGTAPPERRRARTRARTSTAGAGAKNEAEREAILGALVHGSHTVGELVLVTALSATGVNGNLRWLAADGAIERTEREGKTAWSLVATD